ncbi:hypothetical protein [Schinkia azotoformans]|uniref:hypothetical protein n=1 Tax=Schinkia azotoformans TaxID=1454 RepID=UPI002DBAF832|nr:hypothetical protein [Schinkia azotoformans]MEC1780071.1 hypothetical protein [Schinkia azotoformans]MED4330850.1 hypothetical protein [Schinkia azotoformans]
MNKYIKGNKEIYATDKAYEVLYKEQGYKPFEDKKEETIEVKPTKTRSSRKKETPQEG